MKIPSAVDAVVPAFERVKQLLFVPFRLRKWAKLAIVTMLMGGGGGGGGSGNIRVPSGAHSTPGGSPEFGPLHDWLTQHWHLLFAGIMGFTILLFLLALLFTYIASVMRFIFMDSVIQDRVEIRRAWHELKRRGRSYWLFRWAVGLLTIVGMAFYIGLAVGIGYSAGVFTSHNSTLIPGFVLMVIPVVLLVVLLALVVALFMSVTMDLVLPVMYVRNVGIVQGWKVFLPLLERNLGRVAVYLLLKFALGIGAGIIALFVVIAGLLVLAIPIGLIGLLVYGLVSALGLSWSWYWLIVIIPAGFVVLLGIAFYFNLLLLPLPVFFQAYALKFLGFLDGSLVTLPDAPPTPTSMGPVAQQPQGAV